MLESLIKAKKKTNLCGPYISWKFDKLLSDVYDNFFLQFFLFAKIALTKVGGQGNLKLTNPTLMWIYDLATGFCGLKTHLHRMRISTDKSIKIYGSTVVLSSFFSLNKIATFFLFIKFIFKNRNIILIWIIRIDLSADISFWDNLIIIITAPSSTSYNHNGWIKLSKKKNGILSKSKRKTQIRQNKRAYNKKKLKEKKICTIIAKNVTIYKLLS